MISTKCWMGETGVPGPVRPAPPMAAVSAGRANETVATNAITTVRRDIRTPWNGDETARATKPPAGRLRPPRPPEPGRIRDRPRSLPMRVTLVLFGSRGDVHPHTALA